MPLWFCPFTLPPQLMNFKNLKGEASKRKDQGSAVGQGEQRKNEGRQDRDQGVGKQEEGSEDIEKGDNGGDRRRQGR